MIASACKNSSPTSRNVSNTSARNSVKYVLPHAPHVYKMHFTAVQIRTHRAGQKHRHISVFASRALKMLRLNPPFLRFFRLGSRFSRVCTRTGLLRRCCIRVHHASMRSSTRPSLSRGATVSRKSLKSLSVSSQVHHFCFHVLQGIARCMQAMRCRLIAM